MTDMDPDRVAYTVGLLHQLHKRDPELTILPAHDRDVWKEIFGGEAPVCLPAP